MISTEAAMQAARSLAVMAYFPADEIAVTQITDEILGLCQTLDQAHWLIKKMLRTYTTWPGLRELRACFCSKFRPADGFEVASSVYLEGVPSDSEQLPAWALPPPEYLQLAAPDQEPPSSALEIELIRRYRRRMPGEPSPFTNPESGVSETRAPIQIIRNRPAILRECGCDGSGVKPGTSSGYCDCLMGVELRRVETRHLRTEARRSAECRMELERMGV